MPRSAKDNLEIREARREDLLAAAMRVFADKGFAGAKISEVAAEAGLSHGLVYHYFDSKEAVLIELAQRMMRQLDADTETPGARAIDRLRAVVTRRREALDQPLSPIRVVVQAALQGSLPESTKLALHAHFARFAARMQAWIAEAQAAGDVDDAVDAEQIVRVISYLLRGMAVRVQGQTQQDQAPLPLPTTDAILELLLPAPRPRPPKRGASPKPPAKDPRKRP